jgi:hypothetical protein
MYQWRNAMTEVKLHIGYVGITREGNRVEIAAGHGGEYSWTDHALTWRTNGRYNRHHPYHRLDIVGPWEEKSTQTSTDYDDGNWHRWNGGRCPVHPKSMVTVSFINVYEEMVTMDGKAEHCNWLAGKSIIAFKVVTKYTEPREAWVSLNDYQAHESEAAAQDYDAKLGCQHGYFHVREVFDD